MFLSNLTLQDFRSYTKSSFSFDQQTAVIVGPNTSGKTNLIEAIYILSAGKSFRTEKDSQLIQFEKQMSRVKGIVADTTLEVVFLQNQENVLGAPQKKFLVNGVAKTRVSFASHLPSVLFSPLDIDIVIDSPGARRNFLDSVLEQTDSNYRIAVSQYAKALRQRNALLERVQETGVRNEKQFAFWDETLISYGNAITTKREAFLMYINQVHKDILDFVTLYDKSTISQERLLQYKEAEVGAGVTLVGPHRDDFSFQMTGKNKKSFDVKQFASRGQQRLVVLQLKLLQLLYMEKILDKRPLLLLDDIFSELDEEHIQLVMKMIGKQQTILTTTHIEFIGEFKKYPMHVIELQKA